MKMLFEACHNYATTKDGSYFKLLREKGSFPGDPTHKNVAMRFGAVYADWQPTPEQIAELEAGQIEPWLPCLSQSVIQSLDEMVFRLNNAGDIPETASDVTESDESILQEQCQTLGFEFAKQRCFGGGWLYCLTDTATKLYYCHEDFDRIKAAAKSAKNEQLAQAASQPKAKKTKAAPLAAFDPFDL